MTTTVHLVQVCVVCTCEIYYHVTLCIYITRPRACSGVVAGCRDVCIDSGVGAEGKTGKTTVSLVA
jgi:hypothetical protein